MDIIFDDKSISSIGGRGQKNPPALLQFIRDTLAQHEAGISALMEATGFTTKSLSSMLNGAGKDLATGITALVENKAALKQIIDEGTFDAKSLSSMLNGAGKDLATGITALVENKAALKQIIDEGTFDAKSLSSMLAGAGKDLATGITVIQERMPKLKALATIFEPSAIATQLNKRTVKQLGSAIDQMFDKFQKEINGDTRIPAGSKPVIAFRSTAAVAPEQQVGG